MNEMLLRLESIQELKTLKSQRDIRDISKQEAVLRQQIATLDNHRHACHALEADGQVMRSIGADILWLAWIDRRKSELMIDLAKLLARKETAKVKGRKDAGRQESIQETVRKERESVEKQRSARALEQAIGISQITAAHQQTK